MDLNSKEEQTLMIKSLMFTQCADLIPEIYHLLLQGYGSNTFLGVSCKLGNGWRERGRDQ